MLFSACNWQRHTGSDSTKGNSQSSKQKATEYLLNEEDYDVYSAILEQWKSKDNIDNIIISGHTFYEEINRDHSLLQGKAGLLQMIPNELFDDLAGKNNNEYLLSDKFLPIHGLSLILVDEKSLFSGQDKIHTRAEWLSFFERFPNSQGLLTLSRVGFDVAKTKALAYVTNSVGIDGSVGALIYLEKNDGKRRVARSLQLWVT